MEVFMFWCVCVCATVQLRVCVCVCVCQTLSTKGKERCEMFSFVFLTYAGGQGLQWLPCPTKCVTEGEAPEDAQLCTCLVKTVDFGSVHALFVFCSVIHVQQAMFRFHFRRKALLDIPDVTYDSNSWINVGLSGRWTYDAHVWFFRFSGLAEWDLMTQ